MQENANETIDLAAEDIRERKQVQSQRDFEPLLDTEEAARLLRMPLELFARKHGVDQFPLSRLESVGAFVPPRWIVGSANSPADHRYGEEQKTSRPKRIADLF
jgi:hypothetical protein